MTGDKMKILYQDSALVVVEKPAGYQVHTPEHLAEQGKVLSKNNVMLILRDQLGQWVYPVHRLDRATSGVLLFALSSEVAKLLQEQFKKNEIKKRYYALVRGWTSDAEKIESTLTTRLDGGSEVAAITSFQKIAQLELPIAVGPYASARYSLLEVFLETGRLHQIRRHLKRVFHPIVGDTVHGDGKHNQFWRKRTQRNFLYLKAYSIEFIHPLTHEKIYVRSNWGKAWHQIFDELQICPYTPPSG